jgi:hypothetical protein
MGFLFGGSRPKSNSMVVNWAEKRWKEVQKEDAVRWKEGRGGAAVTPDVLFVLFMYTVSAFASPKNLANKELMPLNVDFAAHYANDAVLFEVGCYACVMADLWLFHNRPSERDQISKSLDDRFIRLFTEALQIENVADLFWHRLGKHREIVRSGEPSDSVRFACLGVLRAKDNRRPNYYDLKDEPLMRFGAIEGMAIHVKTAEWLKAFFPSIIEALEMATGPTQEQRTKN